MKRQERLEHLAKEIFLAKEKEKIYKEAITDLRDKFFDLLEDDIRGKSHLLPVQTIEVPKEFFDSSGLSERDFIGSRFPGWDVEHVETNIATGMHTFVLKKNPRYIPGVVEVDLDGKKLRVSKEIAEFEPDIDWTTLEREDPELYEELIEWESTPVLNEEALERMIEEKPEVLEKLRRHMHVKSPSLRATAREIKSGKE
jgi:hypothetical protein